MENIPRLGGKRVPLFRSPFSNDTEGLNNGRDLEDAVHGSQEIKQVSNAPSMSLNDQSQPYMYQTNENHSYILPLTMEDSPPACYNVDTPNNDRLGDVAVCVDAPSSYNGQGTFAGAERIPEKKNTVNSIHKRNFGDDKIESADTQEGLVINEQLYRKHQIESKDCLLLSPEETSLSPVHNSDQSHNTPAIIKPSLSSVGKRSTSQILALLGKGSGKFKPPIKQLDSDWMPKVSETLPHAGRADLKTQCHGTVSESPSVTPVEQLFIEDIDVMELLGQVDVSTAVSCINPLSAADPDVNSSRITHEMLGRCSHETVQGNEAIPNNLHKPSKLVESNKSVLVGSTEKRKHRPYDNI